MPNGDPRDGFFYPTLTLMIHSYNVDLSDKQETPEEVQATEAHRMIYIVSIIYNSYIIEIHWCSS